ncbi:MAG: DNA polymerase Y family protein [Acidobacteriaceae bacterium]
MSKPAELYACIYLKQFPAQAILRLRPELREKPCVVLSGDPPLERICSLNTNARLRGFEVGMTRVEVDTFPESTALSRSTQTEQSARMALLECAGAFSPRIEDCSTDANALIALDIAGTQSLFGAPEKLARKLLDRVRSLGFVARLTVSRNFHAAVCVARGPAQRAVSIIPPGEEHVALSPLPLHVLTLTELQADTLAAWGIVTLGMLAALPEEQLIARMGQEGRRLRQLARGVQPHLFQPIAPAHTLKEQIELEAPVELLESLLFVVAVLLDQLISRALARILSLASLTITVQLEGGGTYTRTVRPALPSTDKHLWLKLLQLDLEAHPPQAPIVGIILRADPGSTSKIQLGLFSPQVPEASRLDVTLARIGAIVGENNVGRAVLEDTHAAESYRIEPFTVPTTTSSSPIPALPPRAAMRQVRPPEKLSLTHQNSRPTAFFFRERRYIVEHAYGPWHISGEWWTDTLWGAEQWDLVARAADGTMLCCCVVHDLLQNTWQMAALYD